MNNKTIQPHNPGGKVKTKLKSEVIGSALFSPDRIYRYSLTRHWGDGDKKILWIGMNPSTADENHNDPTCTREMNYTKDWGYNHYIKCNVMDWRATFPKDIPTEEGKAASAAGREVLLNYAKESTMTIAGWGKLPKKLEHESLAVKTLLLENNIPLYVLGLNKNGSPKHPLYLKKDLKPFKWI